MEQFYAQCKIKGSLRYAGEHLSARLAGGRSFTSHWPACMPAKITCQNHLRASQNHLCSGAGLILHCRSSTIWKRDGLKLLIQVWSKLLMSMQQWRASLDRSADGLTERNHSLKLKCVFSLGVCVYTLKRGMNSSFYSILLCIKIGVTALGRCNHVYIYIYIVHQTLLTLERASVYHAELKNRYDDRARNQHCTIMRPNWREPGKYEKQQRRVLHGFLIT